MVDHDQLDLAVSVSPTVQLPNTTNFEKVSFNYSSNNEQLMICDLFNYQEEGSVSQRCICS